MYPKVLNYNNLIYLKGKNTNTSKIWAKFNDFDIYNKSVIKNNYSYFNYQKEYLTFEINIFMNNMAKSLLFY